MKLNVRSLRVPFSFKRDRLRFFGKSTVLNVHETGFTVEGMIPEVWYPILIRFIHRAVSEWTLRSIPFSRVRKFNIVKQGGIRFAILLLWSLLIATLCNGVSELAFIILLLINAIITYFLLRLLFKDFVEVEYENKNGRKCAMRLRFRSSSDQMRMFQELSRHRLDLAAPALAKVASDVTSRRGFWSFLRRKGGRS